MSQNQVKIEKSQLFDGIEIKSATFINKNFPLHFHQSWSLACVEHGSENISFENSSFMLSKRALILIPPYSIHRHWGNENSAWGYKAIYLNSDVIKSVARKVKIDYSNLESFPYFITYVDNGFEISEITIFDVLIKLFLEAIADSSYSASMIHKEAHFEDILSYLSQHFNESITLDGLEKKFKINKFNLQKSFKKKIGLTPAEYLTATRIENSKQLFFTDSTLTEIALESGFYDQSHYTHNFLKFVGVTPGAYKRSVKILQE